MVSFETKPYSKFLGNNLEIEQTNFPPFDKEIEVLFPIETGNPPNASLKICSFLLSFKLGIIFSFISSADNSPLSNTEISIDFNSSIFPLIFSRLTLSPIEIPIAPLVSPSMATLPRELAPARITLTTTFFEFPILTKSPDSTFNSSMSLEEIETRLLPRSSCFDSVTSNKFCFIF